MSVTESVTGARSEALAAIVPAITARRDLVYSYLDAWPGLSNYRPEHIQEGLLAYIRQRGKGVRPALVMLSCGAMGGDEESVVPLAAAVEVYHVWTLVHDDIIDRDDTRRGQPTVHAAFSIRGRDQFNLEPDEADHYGASVAILAGDLQQSWSYALLCDLVHRGVPAGLVVELVAEMANVLTPRLMEGELLDVQFSLDKEARASSEAVLDMLRKKTSALLRYGAWAGARVGVSQSGCSPEHVEAVARFAELCGVAFQLHDDVLGLVADEKTLGKPVGSDLREGKETYVARLALDRVGATGRSQIMEAWGNRQATADQILRAVDAIKDTGAIERTRELAEDLISQATNILNTLPPTPQRQLLNAWAMYLLNRQH